jgi:hypothetical protein
VHALVAGGALSPDGKWHWPGRGFLFPVQALSRVFRGKFLDALCSVLAQGKPWVVYAKQTVTDPDKVLDYLSRYTHKTAISNHRLLSADEHSVHFSYRDRANGNRRRSLQLPAQQFLERPTTHVLPRGFMRIRHYGLLANRNKTRLLAQAAHALNRAPAQRAAPESAHALCVRVWHLDIDLCPTCGTGRLLLRAALAPAPRQRAPP